MKALVQWISILLLLMLLFGGCTDGANSPTVAPTKEEAQTPTEESTQTTHSEPEEDDDSVAIESLLGVDDLRMQTVSEQNHPYDMSAKLYTYRFYSKNSGDLLVIENVLRYELDDFDGDGLVELFAQVLEDQQYIFCDLVDGQIVIESCDLVPDTVLDYEMLLDADDYYLYEEKWDWFFKDPAMYVAEVAKRPEDRLYAICPNGIIPAYTDVETMDNAVTVLQQILSGDTTDYERKVVYKILTTVELSYTQRVSPGDVDYQILFEKWDYPYEGSSEEKNCYEQMSDLFDADPVLFLKGMASVDESLLKKDLHQVAVWLAKENYLYDADAFERALKWLEKSANTDREKMLTQMFREAFEAMEAPSLEAGTMLNGQTTLWDALSYNPEQALRNLSTAKDTELKHLGQKLWGSEPPSGKLLEKCYAAVNSLLAKNPADNLRDVCYQVLLYVEWYGGYRDEYVEGQPFDYQRLFDKWIYSDGSLATNCLSQMYKVFDADPESFMTALLQWNKTAPEGRNMESIALSFGYQYQGDADYAKTLQALLENPAAEEAASVFISQREKINNQ